MQDLNNKATNGSLTSSEWNGTRSEVQNVIENAGLTLSGGDLNQLGKAISDLVANADFYTDSGTASAQVLTAVSSNQPPTAYKDGMRIRYRVNVTNTGAVTVVVAGLVAKNVYYNGAVQAADRSVAGDLIEAIYNNAAGRFDITETEEPTTFLITGYSLPVAFYESKLFNVTSQDTDPVGIFFKPDGLSMYMVGTANDTVYQYTLSTAWDVSTASYASKSFDFSTQDTGPVDIFFKPDGLSMYMVGTANDTVYQYTLSTAWDVSTASYASKSFSVTTQDASPVGMFIKPDGLSMYIMGLVNDTVYQYTLSTAWDVSTASYASKSFSVTSEETSPRSVQFSNDGLSMCVVGSTDHVVYKYILNTAWDVSTAFYDNKSFSVDEQDASPIAIHFKPNGAKMYMLGSLSESIYQYSTNFVSV